MIWELKTKKVKGYWYIVFYNPSSLPRILFVRDVDKNWVFLYIVHMRLFFSPKDENSSFFLITRTLSLNTFPFCPATRSICAKCHVKIPTMTVVSVVSTFSSSSFLWLGFSLSIYNSLILLFSLYLVPDVIRLLLKEVGGGEEYNLRMIY